MFCTRSQKLYGKNAKDLYKALEKLVIISNDDASSSSPLFALLYRHKFRDTTYNNTIVINDFDSLLDFETATTQAKQLFEKMCSPVQTKSIKDSPLAVLSRD
jgi:hypothetical protein